MEAPGDVCFVSAGALLLGEGLVKGEAELEKALLHGGVPPERLKFVMRTLAPIAHMKHAGPPASPPVAAGEPGLLKRFFGKS
jgi:hypothetical protein